MDELKIEEEKEEEEEGELQLDLSLSLVPQSYTSNPNSSNEMVRLLHHREQMHNRIGSSSSSSSAEQQKMLVFEIASSINESDSRPAISALINLYDTASLTGDSTQRVAACFADAFTAKLLENQPGEEVLASRLGEGQQLFTRNSPGEELLAFTHLYRVSPCLQLSHFTANQAILEAFDAQLNAHLHVLDFDLAYGFQWHSLVQSLSLKASPANPISLRITGFAATSEHLVETEARLVSFASAFTNLDFHFQGLLFTNNINQVVKTMENETVAVNLVMTNCLHSGMGSETLAWVRSLGPSIVVLVEPCGRGSLIESLPYYTALFGSLDDCLPRDSLDRLCIERVLLAKHIKSVVLNCFNDDRPSARAMEEHGFCRINLSSTTLMQAKLLLRMRSHNPGFNSRFRVSETHNGKAISLAWQDTELVTASAWHSSV